LKFHFDKLIRRVGNVVVTAKEVKLELTVFESKLPLSSSFIISFDIVTAELVVDSSYDGATARERQQPDCRRKWVFNDKHPSSNKIEALESRNECNLYSEYPGTQDNFKNPDINFGMPQILCSSIGNFVALSLEEILREIRPFFSCSSKQFI
jgi:hypothetical protein